MAATRLSVFDLDRTLTRRGTFSPFLLFAARRYRPWRLAYVPAVLTCMILYKSKMISRSQLKEVMLRLLLGARTPRARVNSISRKFAARLIDDGCYAQGKSLISAEKAEGRIVMIVTAAHRFYAEALAERLGVVHVVATESVWDGDYLTPDIAGSNCHGPAKPIALENYLATLGITAERADIRFFSDDYSDLPMFERSGEPHAVNPSRRLRLYAQKRGWPILQWK